MEGPLVRVFLSTLGLFTSQGHAVVRKVTLTTRRSNKSAARCSCLASTNGGGDCCVNRRANGVPVDYIVFDDDGHGFVNTEKRERGYEAILRFLHSLPEGHRCVNTGRSR